MATTEGDQRTVQWVLDRWRDPHSGLDQAWTDQYLVYLSFPNPQTPNSVTVGLWTTLRISFTFQALVLVF